MSELAEMQQFILCCSYDKIETRSWLLVEEKILRWICGSSREPSDFDGRSGRDSCVSYSERRAWAGSRRVARHAGRMQAPAAVRARTMTTVVKTLQSNGLMP